MKNILMLGLGVLGTLGLTGCGTTEVDTIMNVTTTLPASAGATEDLPITVKGVNGCTYFYKIEESSRGNNKIELVVRGKTKNPCPAIPSAAAFEQTFIDKTTTPRTNPFEVWVNGSKVGTVEIK